MGIRSALHLKSSVGDKYTMPHACFNMTAREKDGFLQILKDVRVPDGYASNISRRVNLKNRTISGLKSHDNHILMQQLLPIALRGSLRASVTRPLMKLSCFFREICSKTLKVSEIENLEKDIAVTLCELEKIFPPSFFTVMVHLVIHLATEAKICGPVHYRWMYPIERYLSRLKSYVRNRAAPEGSIAEGYYVEECLTFCARYMKGVETIFNRPTRLIEGSTGPVLSMELMNIELTQAHRYILFSSKEITKFIEMHRKLVEEELQNAHRRVSENVINKHHMEQFCSWLRHHVFEGGMGRKRRLELVESGQCSSHAIGSQQEETRNAALEEDIPHGATHDDDATEPPDDMVATPANVVPRAKRGSTLMRDIWNLPPGAKHVLHLNSEGQPIGSSGATFKRWIGTITRKYYMCPVVPIDWREVPIQYKRECWGEIERQWAIPANKVPLEKQEDWAMQLLGLLRRACRTTLKKQKCLEGMSKQEVVANIPNNCDEEQWKKLVEYWFIEEVQTKALKNKASRGFQKEIPTTGPRSLAQLVAIMENETGRPVERAVVYDKAYRRKDGTPVTDKAAENIRKMQELLNAGTQLIGESSHGGGVLWAPDDAFAQVMGQERNGRVRGVGFRPTPSGRKAKDVLPGSTTP
nr:uncharacterized protein LOC112034251 [Quercus suber]